MLPKPLVAAALAAAILPASAGAAITRTSVLTPADPHYRVYTIQNKDSRHRRRERDDRRRAPATLVDIVCDHDDLKRNVAVDEAGRFATPIADHGVPRRASARSARCRPSSARRTTRRSPARAARSRSSTPSTTSSR